MCALPGGDDGRSMSTTTEPQLKMRLEKYHFSDLTLSRLDNLWSKVDKGCGMSCFPSSLLSLHGHGVFLYWSTIVFWEVYLDLSLLFVVVNSNW